MSRILKVYMGCLKLHPFKTQALTTGVLMSAGDGISQTLVEKRGLKEYDLKRTSRFFVLGTFMIGPALRVWFVFLDRTIKRPPPVGVLQKLALDQHLIYYLGAILTKAAFDINGMCSLQFIMSPTILASILGSLTLWNTYSFKKTKEKLEKDFFTVLFNGYKIWPAAQLINFYVIPLQHRILFVNTVALFWNIYLAYKSVH